MNKVYAAQKQIESKVAKYISLSVFRACHDFRSLYVANKKIIEMYNLQSIFTLVCLLLTMARTLQTLRLTFKSLDKYQPILILHSKNMLTRSLNDFIIYTYYLIYIHIILSTYI